MERSELKMEKDGAVVELEWPADLPDLLDDEPPLEAGDRDVHVTRTGAERDFACMTTPIVNHVDGVRLVDVYVLCGFPEGARVVVSGKNVELDLKLRRTCFANVMTKFHKTLVTLLGYVPTTLIADFESHMRRQHDLGGNPYEGLKAYCRWHDTRMNQAKELSKGLYRTLGVRIDDLVVGGVNTRSGPVNALIETLLTVHREARGVSGAETAFAIETVAGPCPLERNAPHMFTSVQEECPQTVNPYVEEERRDCRGAFQLKIIPRLEPMPDDLVDLVGDGSVPGYVPAWQPGVRKRPEEGVTMGRWGGMDWNAAGNAIALVKDIDTAVPVSGLVPADATQHFLDAVSSKRFEYVRLSVMPTAMRLICVPRDKGRAFRIAGYKTACVVPRPVARSSMRMSPILVIVDRPAVLYHEIVELEASVNAEIAAKLRTYLLEALTTHGNGIAGEQKHVHVIFEGRMLVVEANFPIDWVVRALVHKAVEKGIRGAVHVRTMPVESGVPGTVRGWEGLRTAGCKPEKSIVIASLGRSKVAAWMYWVMRDYTGLDGQTMSNGYLCRDKAGFWRHVTAWNGHVSVSSHVINGVIVWHETCRLLLYLARYVGRRWRLPPADPILGSGEARAPHLPVSKLDAWIKDNPDAYDPRAFGKTKEEDDANTGYGKTRPGRSMWPVTKYGKRTRDADVKLYLDSVLQYSMRPLK